MTKPKCPRCGRQVTCKDGEANGHQRWKCVPCKWRGTAALGLEVAAQAGVDQEASGRLHRRLTSDKRRVKRYVITAAQNATPVNKAFFASLKNYCAVNNAQLIVIPLRYKNPTSVWSEQAKDDDWWAGEVVPYLMDKRTELNANLIVLADIKTQPTASTPLQGFDSISGSQSAIIGHPKLELTTVATPHQKTPKILTTTGACTLANYIDSKAGRKGEFHHTYGACVVEIAGSIFHLRQLNALRDGSFQDLDVCYAGARSRRAKVTAVVMGDSHVEFIDPSVVEATFGSDGIVTTLKPEFLVWHDVHDAFARNHHDAKDPFINLVKHQTGLGNVEKALDATFKFIDDHTPPGQTNIFVSSNHPNEHLGRWIRETDPRSDVENCVFWSRTFEAMCLGSRMTTAGPKTIDPFTYWAKKKIKKVAQCRFLECDESMLVKGVEIGFHGHQGANGSRGSRKSFGRIGVKTIIGHSHSPGVRDGVYQVGTSSYLRLAYNHGPSSWLHTHCLLYENGKRSLVNVIGGRWRP